MHILHLIPYMHPSAGGPPVVVDRWCTELSRRGVTVSVMTTDSYAPDRGNRQWVDDYAKNYEIDVFPLRGPKGFGYGEGMRTKFCDVLSRVDLVHVHNLWGYPNRLAASVCGRKGVPFVVSTHGMLDPNSVRRKGWKKRLYGTVSEWPSLRKATGLVFTHAEEERLARTVASGLPRGFIVPLASDAPQCDDRNKLRAEFLAGHPGLVDAPRVVFFGRLHEKKGVELLLRAFAKLRQTQPNAVLILAGPGEPAYVAHLRLVVAILGIEAAVMFTGPVQGEAKWRLLAGADLFVLPSYQENFAIAVIEALRVATPVLLSDRVNIASDLVAAGAAAQCELTVVSVSEQIRRLLEDPQACRGLGENGRKLAVESYTWSRSVEQLVKVYENCQRFGASHRP